MGSASRMNRVLCTFAILCFALKASASFWDDMPTSLSIYTELPTTETNFPPYSCVRLANKDGAIGCSSSLNGDSGTFWPLNTEEDMNELEKSPPSHDTIVVVTPAVFNRNNVDKFVAMKRIKGILVVPGDAPADGFSTDSTFPQKQYGLYTDSDYEWNPLGDEFSFQSYNIPMFILSTSNNDTAAIVEQAARNKAKGGFPQFGARFNSRMYTSRTSVDCLRRGQCEPLGGKSVWATFGEHVDSSLPIILAQAAYDSNAFFHDIAVGADSAISGTVGVMLAAEALSRMNISSANLKKQIIFAFFAGESWGYLGSKRFISDVKSFKCKEEKDDYCTNPFQPSLEFTNIKLDNIEAIIELNQIGTLSETGAQYNLYAHQDPAQRLNALYQIIRDASQGANVSVSAADTSTPGIPPSSAMSFLKENISIPTVVLAEHQAHYTNKYYHSRFDNDTNVNATHICEVGTLLARSLWSLGVNGSIPDELTANCELSKELVYCFTSNMDCELSYGRYLFGYGIDPQPSQYTSVWRKNGVLTPISTFVLNFMADMTANNRTAENCTSDSQCQEGGHCLGTECVYATAYFHNALSLAFDEDKNIQDKYWETESTWTESNWGGVKVEIFLVENPAVEIAVFVLGILDLLVSFGVIFGLRKFFTKRFKST
eukprot:TRINITY_DN3009_c0_g1_i1.p1 TRINITY_DN3009_c0_g1~~TRINITY_DN3009_c0_g1_i1.p1  ORF type:complete len:657 (-),score=92.61 TRINITY_DN3009_c0_g1_i1:31-2001(-)